MTRLALSLINGELHNCGFREKDFAFGWDYRIFSMMSESYWSTGSLSRIREAEAIRRCAVLRLAQSLFATEHGKTPAAPSDLAEYVTEKELTDPFTGEPLKWRTSDKGLVFWSVGRNLADDKSQDDDMWIKFVSPHGRAAR
jgi:hypothetical protein